MPCHDIYSGCSFESGSEGRCKDCHKDGGVDESVDEAPDTEEEHEGSGKDGEPVAKAPDNDANGTETSPGKLFSFAFDVVPH